MKTQLVILGAVCLTQSAHADCNLFRQKMEIYEGLCNGTMDIADVCTTVTKVIPIPFIGLLCAFPAGAASVACEKKDDKRRDYERCLVHEAKNAAYYAMAAKAQSEREAWVRPQMERYLNDQNNIYHYYDLNAQWYVDACYQRHEQIGDLDTPEAQKDCANLEADFEAKRDFAFATAKHGIEAAWVYWGWELQELGYTEWDQFIADCIVVTGNARGCVRRSCINGFNDKIHFEMMRCKDEL
jgi:hypothetical protein